MADDKRVIVSGLKFIYPKLSKPDTFGKFANGKYKTKFSFNDKAKEDGFKGWCKAKAKELMPSAKKHTMPWTVDEETEQAVFSASTTDKPFIGDGQNNKLPQTVQIGGGTEGNLSLGFGSYENRFCLYINAVQVTKLVEYQRTASEDRDSPFAPVAGAFTYEGDADPSGEGDEASPDSSSNDKDADPLTF
jgi:hypothetical protein